MPVYQDWDSVGLLCKELDTQLRRLPHVQAEIILVDDGSPNGVDDWVRPECAAVVRISALRLRTNLGHQRAICAGLCHIHDNVSCDAVLVMDADGEDRPEDAVRLIELAEARPERTLFAERRKRREGLLFRVLYWMFRMAHRVLTGIPVRVGNFSIVPFTVLSRLTCMPELWNHYAGAVYRSKAPFGAAPMDRGGRLCGESHMNLPSLVAHGIAGIATFQTIVATRILIVTAICLALTCLLVVVIAGIRLLTPWAIAGWATYSIGLAVILAVQLAALAFSLVFTLIANRTSMPFVPRRDYAMFVDRIECL
jgi:hypothetical protein